MHCQWWRIGGWIQRVVSVMDHVDTPVGGVHLLVGTSCKPESTPLYMHSCNFLTVRLHALRWCRPTLKLSLTPTQLPARHPWPYMTPSLLVMHCVACVHVMMIGMQRKMIVRMYPSQTNLAGNSYKCCDISAEKTEAINQCPGWIVFAVCGSYARGSLGWRLCCVIVEAYMCLMEKSPGASLHPRWCRFSPHGEVALHRMSLPGGGNPQSLTLTLCSPDHFTMGWFTCLIWIWLE